MLNKFYKSNKGFTLVELMIVVAIIALLATIAIPGFVRARKRTQIAKVINAARILDAAADQWAVETNKSDGATAPTVSDLLNPDGNDATQDGYLKQNTGISGPAGATTGSGSLFELDIDGIEFTVNPVGEKLTVTGVGTMIGGDVNAAVLGVNSSGSVYTKVADWLADKGFKSDSN
jgi:prepilin-type N-terminal cleavage/methylation domain-containing protein